GAKTNGPYRYGVGVPPADQLPASCVPQTHGTVAGGGRDVQTVPAELGIGNEGERGGFCRRQLQSGSVRREYRGPQLGGPVGGSGGKPCPIGTESKIG